MVNGQFVENWQSYVPDDHDEVIIVPKAGAWITPFIIPAIISSLISAVLNLLISALTPKPKQPNQPKNESQRFGVAGLDNTVEEGTPALVCYGEKRIWPHVIGSRTDVSEDGRHMTFSVLGFCGDTGGDGYESCSEIEVNDIKLSNFAGASFEFRTGTNDQSIIQGFDNVEQVFADGRSIPNLVEIQSIELRGTPTGGTYTLHVEDFGDTAAIPFNADAAAVQAALRAISGLGSVSVEEQGTPPNRLFSVSFDGVAGDVEKMTVTDTFTPRRASIRIDTIVKGTDGSDSPIVASTRSAVNRATLIFSVPGMFTLQNEKAAVQIKIEKKRSAESASAWVQVDGNPEKTEKEGGGPYPLFWRDRSLSALFKPFVVELGAVADFWDFRLSLVKSTSKGGAPQLFNIQETQFTSRNYPGSALLCLRGIGSHEIQSLAGMRWSAKWKGKKCKVWNGSSFTTEWTDKRMWILRDVKTHPKVGLGHRIHESTFDDDAALVVQNYLDEIVDGERRDICDLLVNEQRPGWNYITEDILGEAACSIIPSGRKLKPLVDRPRTPNLLWAYPGNILDDEGGPVKTVLALPTKSINTLRGTFSDRTRSDRTGVIEVQLSTMGSDPIRPDSYQYDTVSRASQVRRHLNYLLKKAQNKSRRTWKAGSAGQVIQPLDCDYLSDDKVKNIRGWQGKLPAGSTATVVNLPRLVEFEGITGGGSGGGSPLLDEQDQPLLDENGQELLDESPAEGGGGSAVTIKTYEIIVRHQANNVVEKRVIASLPGKWGQIAVTVPFTTIPAEGDIWAIGEQGVAIIPVVHESVTMTEDGNFRIVSSLYDESVFDPPGTVAAPQVNPIGSVSGAPPIPLHAVAVSQQLVPNEDGSFAVNLLFDVTPGLHKVAGKLQGGSISLS